VGEYGEEFRIHNGVLHVRLSGAFPNEVLLGKANVFQPLMDQCAAHDCTRAVIDVRDLHAEFGTMGLFRAGEDAVELTRRGLRIALVARADMIDSFFENVVVNRGGRLRIFKNMASARRWVER
jgi:hypothetical protein